MEQDKKAPIAPVLLLTGCIPSFSSRIHLCKVKSSAGLGAFPGASKQNKPWEDQDEDDSPS